MTQQRVGERFADADEFPGDHDGPVVQGGLVTALLDGPMGGACWSVLDRAGDLLATSRCTQVVLPA